MFIKRNINKLNAVNNATQRACDKQQIIIIANNKIISSQNKKQIAHATLLKFLTYNYKLNYYSQLNNNKKDALLILERYNNYIKENKINKAELNKILNINSDLKKSKIIYNSLKGNINYFKSLENKYNMSDEQFAYYKLNKMETI